MSDQGDEHITDAELKDRLEQLRAVNRLTKREKITPAQRTRAHNKIVDGLGDEMERTRRYTNNDHGR